MGISANMKKLFTPAWNSDSKEKRMKAVEKIIAKNNQRKLEEIALESKYDDVVKKAFENIKNSSVREKIVKLH